jgi:hypothetical protein
MKIKARLLAALFVAGLVASLAFAKPPKPPKPGTATQTTTTATSTTNSSSAATTTTSHNPKCAQVELKGNATTGSVAFTVTKANKRGRNLVGTQVTLVVPAGAKVKAKACSAVGGSLTLRDLHVQAAPAKP